MTATMQPQISDLGLSPVQILHSLLAPFQEGKPITQLCEEAELIGAGLSAEQISETLQRHPDLFIQDAEGCWHIERRNGCA